ncbi:hypothetical protein CORC01_02300 [Colletotrichum orchidophilum]|uniref:Zn(2)-C6 fungal-type domain-containing protein n=1 Tax=Colletotrichum orchidophilum TaxID=1209926 RepID=A0A1G4BLY0_9PEZI|nr:uncharacterized protein CORC01_02300 [Colletotrichum orchidophilum]OHF02307.1 hypothetical protein CORC01_02300 [Colletotrichum orchidophilum]
MTPQRTGSPSSRTISRPAQRCWDGCLCGVTYPISLIRIVDHGQAPSRHVIASQRTPPNQSQNLPHELRVDTRSTPHDAQGQVTDEDWMLYLLVHVSSFVDGLGADKERAGRKRRVKCGEERPKCRNCVASGRGCIWPSSDDMYDRRHRFRRSCSNDRALPSPSSCSEDSITYLELREPPDLEQELIHHYLNVFLSVLLLPTVRERDLEGYGSQVMSMVLRSESVKCAVLAACASNKYMLLRSRRYHDAALGYYFRAVELVNRALHDLGTSAKGPDDPLLTTVVYLYLYDLWGPPDETLDARKHVDGAMNLLKLRYEDTSSPMSMSRPLHRINTESVLYQAFLLAMRKPFAPNFHVDEQFLDRSEHVLNARNLIDILPEDFSPVLGLPLPLYRLITDLIDFLNSPKHPTDAFLTRMREEMDTWEGFVLVEDGTVNYPWSMTSFHKDAVTLFVLGASLLLDYIAESSTAVSTSATRIQRAPQNSWIPLQEASDGPRWQVNRAFEILRRPAAYETWTRCFLGAWPMLILGYSVTSFEDISLIRRVLTQMVERMGYGEIQRILDDLEGVWTFRAGCQDSGGLGIPTESLGMSAAGRTCSV